MKIFIIGGGSFGTALAGQLAMRSQNKITLLLRNKEQEKEINTQHTHTSYFPHRHLNPAIRATTDYKKLSAADLIFLAVPSKSIEEVARQLAPQLKPKTLVVNLIKSIRSDGETIVHYLRKKWKHENVISLKGASFSVDMINDLPTLFTVGFDRKEQLETLMQATQNTNIFLDYTNDVKGVEYLSALKNIYAIALGNIDARYNSVNTRFLILTKAIEEIRTILRSIGGEENTLYLSCGIGDVSLTGLNDLSRNRTLGLLIGKGFYNPATIENNIVLEGTNTVKTIRAFLSENIIAKLPLLTSVEKMLVQPQQKRLDFSFADLFKRKYKTVLTYGTFDLLHFGHLELLRRIREWGDRVIVGLSTDEFNEVKGKKCVMSYEKRKRLLEVLDYVDLVIPEKEWEQKTRDVRKYDVDVFIMGDDWKGKFDFLKPYCQVKYLPRTKGISTTKLKSIIEE